jgi:hypothetical protein
VYVYVYAYVYVLLIGEQQRAQAEEARRELVAPPMMQGWLKKKGHIVNNWKTRYFVLDSGYLTYYIDQSDAPPFGRERKGQVCLAGYRSVLSESSSTAQAAAATAAATATAGGSTKYGKDAATPAPGTGKAQAGSTSEDSVLQLYQLRIQLLLMDNTYQVRGTGTGTASWYAGGVVWWRSIAVCMYVCMYVRVYVCSCIQGSVLRCTYV